MEKQGVVDDRTPRPEPRPASTEKTSGDSREDTNFAERLAEAAARKAAIRTN